MLVIRLTRVGKKKHPTYRVVVQQKQKAPSSNVLEILGHYNPHTNPATVEVKAERVSYWLQKGAQASDTVHNLLVERGVLQAPKRTIARGKKIAAEESGVQAAQKPPPAVESTAPAPPDVAETAPSA